MLSCSPAASVKCGSSASTSASASTVLTAEEDEDEDDNAAAAASDDDADAAAAAAGTWIVAVTERLDEFVKETDTLLPPGPTDKSCTSGAPLGSWQLAWRPK